MHNVFFAAVAARALTVPAILLMVVRRVIAPVFRCQPFAIL